MPALVLPEPPEISAGTTEEIMAAAYALERAAAERYRHLGRAMRKVGREDVARVFEDLAAEEQSHVTSVEQLSQRLLSHPPTQEIVRWTLPETFSAEEGGSLALLTPYKALSIAVRSEERAFAFWSYVAAGAADPTVSAQAEAMARQELLHAAKIRVARRKAYYEERQSRRAGRDAEDQPVTLDLLRAEQARMDGDAASFLSAAAERLADLEDPESAALLRDLCHGTGPSRLSDDVQRRIRSAGRTAILFEATGVLERIADRYMDLLGRSADAAVTAELQRLGDMAMNQVARLNQRLAAVEPDLAALLFPEPPRSGGSSAGG